MSTERAGEIQICPYWNKYILFNGYVLSLCGREDEDKVPTLEDEAYTFKSKECPFGFDALESYLSPQIMEVQGGQFQTIVGTGPVGDGKKPFKYLESIWDQEVEKFIQRHSPK